MPLRNTASYRRTPSHIAFIPDGNRRWAAGHGLPREQGYPAGLAPGFALCQLCRENGVGEVTIYGFTQDNTKRPALQTHAFRQACVDFAYGLSPSEFALLVVGNRNSRLFPGELTRFLAREEPRDGQMKVNLLVNYDWNWDLSLASQLPPTSSPRSFEQSIGSAAIPRIDLIVRWGGHRRLSGMLPVQSVYADLYVLEALWPDFAPADFHEAMTWYQGQDATLGG